ncbi:MAG: hypothetical protein ISS78_06605 [Phycisphaerae bacterium]|nr:hypothetical protein [Phycisphaerae bacterium]
MNKTDSTERRLTRREFFPAAARYGALSVLAGIAAVAAGTKRTRPAAQSCVNKGLCRGCGAFGACRLPAALSAKSAAARL